MQFVLPQFGLNIPDDVIKAGITLGTLGASVAASWGTLEDAENFDLEELLKMIEAQKTE